MPAVSGSVGYNLSNITFSENFGATFGAAQPVPLQSVAQSFGLTVGNGANQFNNCYAVTHSIVSGTPWVINLNNASLNNPDGSTITATDVVFFWLRNNGTAGQNITIGGGSNPITSIWVTTEVVLPLGGISFHAAFGAASGFAITPSTACEIQFVCATGTASVDLMILTH